MAELVGEWVDGVVATRADQAKTRFEPARDDREGCLRQRLAVRPDLVPRDRRRGRRPLVRLPHVFLLARRRGGAALHLRLRRAHSDRAPSRHPRPAGPDQREDVARPLRSVDRGGLPMFRHAIPLRGTEGLKPEQLNDLVEVAISESERFYPAFQYVVWAGKSPTDALTASILETVGEA